MRWKNRKGEKRLRPNHAVRSAEKRTLRPRTKTAKRTTAHRSRQGVRPARQESAHGFNPKWRCCARAATEKSARRRNSVFFLLQLVIPLRTPRQVQEAATQGTPISSSVFYWVCCAVSCLICYFCSINYNVYNVFRITYYGANTPIVQ